jgi:hypothetical protein
MAKGDAKRMQSAIDTQGGRAQNVLTGAQQQTQNQYGTMWNNYGQGVSRDLPTYDSVMGSYNTFLGGGMPGQQQRAPGYGNPMPATGRYSSMSPQQAEQAAVQQLGLTGPNALRDPANQQRLIQELAAGGQPGWQAGGTRADDWLRDPRGGEWDDTSAAGGSQMIRDYTNTGGGPQGAGGFQGAIPGWANMAQTGGFSPQDIANFRARSVSPIRSMYQTGIDDMQRQRALAGGYMPNFAPAMAKMKREESNQVSNAMTNADAAIAQLKQQGQLYGLSGLTNAQLGALSGMTGMYGTSPGLAGTFGNQALQSNQQNLTGAGLQNDLVRTLLDAQMGRSKIPGNFQQAMGNIGSVAGLIAPFLGI